MKQAEQAEPQQPKEGPNMVPEEPQKNPTPAASSSPDTASQKPKDKPPEPDMSPELLPARVAKLRTATEQATTAAKATGADAQTVAKANGLIWALWCMEGGDTWPGGKHGPMFV